MTTWYVGKTQWDAIPAYMGNYYAAAGDRVRAGSRSVFIALNDGNTDFLPPTWDETVGSITTDGEVSWECITGVASYNEGATPWGAPDASINYVFAFANAGDIIYIANDHTETESAMSLQNTNGTIANPIKILSVDPSSAPPTALLAGAYLGGNVAGVSLSSGGGGAISSGLYVYGVTLDAGNGSGSTMLLELGVSNPLLGLNYVFDTCTLKISTSHTGGRINIASNGAISFVPNKVWFKNCDFVFANASQTIKLGDSTIIMEGGSIALTGTVPTTAMEVNTSGKNNPTVIMSGMDLSALNTTLVKVIANTALKLLLKNSRIHSSLAKVTGSKYAIGHAEILVANCSNTTNNYKLYKSNYAGVLDDEIVYYASGGANDGTISYSWKMVSTANASKFFPFESEDIYIWNEDVGSSKTLSIEIANNDGNLYDDEIWIEAEYLGNSSYPKAAFSIDRNVELAATASHDGSGNGWNNAPSWPQVIQITITPQLKGLIKVKVCLGKPSTTVYIDPLIKVS